ncbi:MAG: hypothetical protein KGJ37_01700, partial [Verrucomicrobiota bacterium]|nr:hypothetical protein [Verrucomicrobiota bacterium]
MDEPPAKENPAPDFNKLDLSQLQGFSFGTQWTQDKPASSERAAQRNRREDRSPREGGDRRPSPHETGEPHRDRRTFRRPAVRTGPEAAPAAEEAPAAGAPRSVRAPRQERDPHGKRRGPEGDRRDAGPRRAAPRNAPEHRPPYESPFFSVAFYPEDVSFAALAKTIRASCRTLELFEIARTILAKSDRFIVVVHRKPSLSAASPAAAGGETPASASQAAPFYLSVPDGMPFENEEAAIAHVSSKHLDKFFDIAAVEIEPPKGNFQVVNRCTITGELLGPPNYHKYTQIIQQHHATRLGRMPFEKFRERIESVRDPELINQWLEKMKKATRYIWKLGAPAKPAEKPAPAAEPPAEAQAVTSAENPPAEASQPAGPSFDSLDEACAHLLAHARDKVVRAVEHARFHGKSAEAVPPGEIRRAVEGQLERQRRFPLDTANGLRGRLRRENFTIFKKGSKGISYVCAVKRKFRVPGQAFADSIDMLISFIEAHPMIKAGELPEKLLGIPLPAPQAAPNGEADVPPAAPALELTPEQRETLTRLHGDLRWLVTAGYVTE